MDSRIPVAILGATGAVGQRFIQLLEGHPWFRVAALASSERTQGRSYGEACRWTLDADMPASVRDLPLLPPTPEALNCPLAFSAMPASAAGPLEEELAKAGIAVCSNASSHRMEQDVPLLIPEVNAGHVALVREQQRLRGWSGMIVTGPNCASVPVAVVIKALEADFGVRHAHVVTLQALSGAGYPGVPSLDILDNIIPYIGEEEPKLQREPAKMLGRLLGDHVQDSPVVISAQVNRVHVRDGHTACMSLALERKAAPEEVAEALRAFQGQIASLDLPSAPRPPIIVRDEADRPQPRRDRDAGNGMAIVVGRIQRCPVNDIKLVALSHNTVRGAAGGVILIAELLRAQGLLGVV